MRTMTRAAAAMRSRMSHQGVRAGVSSGGVRPSSSRIAGKRSVAEACEVLGVSPAHFYRMRDHFLNAGVTSLEDVPSSYQHAF